MDNTEMLQLTNMILAPWIQKASALIGVHRKVGGNQFRHCMASMIILIDYHFIDNVMLKASIIHDLFEDFEPADPDSIKSVDKDGEEVLNVVTELTHDKKKETKDEYFQRLVSNSSSKAKIVKLADRISNLTDLHLFVFTKKKTEEYLKETEKYILPMLEQLLASDIPENQKKMAGEMKKEILDLVEIRRIYLKEISSYDSIQRLLLKRLKIIPDRILT